MGDEVLYWYEEMLKALQHLEEIEGPSTLDDYIVVQTMLIEELSKRRANAITNRAKGVK